ncbi:MAG: TolC family protein [Chitinispirillaceae bacterium]|nr:TolC family protein [Chitinispirillaceae bacterium]
MMHSVAAFCGILVPCCITFVNAADSLSLPEAVAAVLENHALVQEVRSRIRAKELGVDQSSLLPNPEVEVEIIGSRAEEIEGRISQTFELGGKRAARKALSRHEVSSGKAEMAIAGRDIELELYTQYLDLVAAVEKRHFVDSMRSLAAEMLRETVLRVSRGAASPLDTLRLQIECDELALQQLELAQEEQGARSAFTALCGDSLARMIVPATIHRSLELPEFTSAVTSIRQRPDVVATGYALQRFDLEEALAGAERYPDLVAAAGVARNGTEKTHEPLLAAAIDLPLWNRSNRSRQIIAQERSAEELKSAYRLAQDSVQLSTLYDKFRICEQRLALLSGATVSRSEQLVAMLETKYANGTVGIAEVITARSNLLQLKAEELDLHIEKAQVVLAVMAVSGMTLEVVK